MNFYERSKEAHNPVAKKLFAIMDKKQTNLAVAADVTTKKEFLHLVRQVGSEICLLKTHIDIIEDFDWDLILQLQELAQHYNFLIVEDRKFCDIGSTVKAQYANGIYKIAQWADIVICHAIAGPAIIDAIKQGAPDRDLDRDPGKAQGKDRALLLVAQMSCQGNLIDQTYTESVAKMAKVHKDFVLGCICQQNCVNDPGMFTIIPGINSAQAHDSLGQQYNTPQKAIIERGADIIIVGRGIYRADNPHTAAQQYRQAAWGAYQAEILNYKETRGISCQAG